MRTLDYTKLDNTRQKPRQKTFELWRFNMLKEFVYHDRLYIICTVAELRSRLKEHAANYPTLKALVEDLAP